MSKLTSFSIAMVLMVTPMALAQEEGRSVGERLDDAVITARVETTFLLNDSLSPFRINTTTKNGVVTLDGSVDSEVERDLAIELAKSAKGVQNVVDALEVQPAEGMAEEDPWQSGVQQATLRANVRKRLQSSDPELAKQIEVRAQADKVTLKGTVPSIKAQRRAIHIAEGTRGVDEVIDDLKVKTPEGEAVAKAEQRSSNWFTDEWLEKRLETSLMLSKHIPMRSLDVEVDNRVCTLTGRVLSEAQRDLAGQMAYDIAGIDDVINNIEVGGDEGT